MCSASVWLISAAIIEIFYLPAGRLKTPAPTILLMRLKTSLGIVAVPPPVDFLLLPPPLGRSATLAASFPRRLDEDVDALAINAPEGNDWRVGVNNA